MSPQLLPILLAGLLSSGNGPPASPAGLAPIGNAVRVASSGGQLVNHAVVAADTCGVVATETTSWSKVKEVYASDSQQKKASVPRPVAMVACCRPNGTCYLYPEANPSCCPPPNRINGNPSCDPNPCTPFTPEPHWENVRVLIK